MSSQFAKQQLNNEGRTDMMTAGGSQDSIAVWELHLDKLWQGIRQSWRVEVCTELR